jgi:hypothetical protein
MLCSACGCVTRAKDRRCGKCGAAAPEYRSGAATPGMRRISNRSRPSIGFASAQRLASELLKRCGYVQPSSQTVYLPAIAEALGHASTTLRTLSLQPRGNGFARHATWRPQRQAPSKVWLLVLAHDLEMVLGGGKRMSVWYDEATGSMSPLCHALKNACELLGESCPKDPRRVIRDARSLRLS